MNNKPTKLRETSGYDELKTQAIDRFRSQDPMTLSNSELRSAIDYMLAYRWALEGDEDVLHEYIEASKIRSNIGNNYKNESRYMNKKLIRLTESDLHKIVKESVNKILRESILSEIDLQVEPQRYGEFWLRDKNTWIEFTAEVWVDRTHLECNVYSNGDDARGEQLTNSKEFVDECLHAIINSGYEDNIEGIQEYLDMYAEKGIDYDEAIHQLESNIGRF